MFELFTLIIFAWLLVNAIGLAFQITWGMAKVIASILMVIAMPVLIVCMVFVGGIALLVPIIMIGMAVGILKSCI